MLAIWLLGFILCFSLNSIDAARIQISNSKLKHFTSFHNLKSKPNVSPNQLLLRGGYALSPTTVNKLILSSPETYFKTILVCLSIVAVSLKAKALVNLIWTTQSDKIPKPVRLLQSQFLRVQWLLDIADYLQGPYFHEVYRSKIINGKPISMHLVSKIFLVGFASTGLFGPVVGKFIDSFGRKAGTLLFTLVYSLEGISTLSNKLSVLFFGRLLGGLGTSLYLSAPEAWLIAEHNNRELDPSYLAQIFENAYLGDSIAAIISGQLAAAAAAYMGPTGPFVLSAGVLGLAALLILRYWNENTATDSLSIENNNNINVNQNETIVHQKEVASIGSALHILKSDSRILLLGLIQSCFEGAMYIFVLQWAPLITNALQQATTRQLFATIAPSLASSVVVPFGLIFSCFMTACFIGAALFGRAQSASIDIEKSTPILMVLATIALVLTTMPKAYNSLAVLTAAFLAFELCVGFYFPSIGLLRSKYLPDSHRSVLMNLYGIPLNLIVVGVFLFIDRLGYQGAMMCASGVMTVAVGAALALYQVTKEQR